MTQLYAMCVLALLVYGLTVGCWDGIHREASVTENVERQRGREVLRVAYSCKCGRRTPYVEVYR